MGRARGILIVGYTKCTQFDPPLTPARHRSGVDGIVSWDLDWPGGLQCSVGVGHASRMPDDKPVLPNAQLDDDDGHVIPPPALRADQLARYTVDHDPASEQDISDYVEGQCRGEEAVQHVEKIKTEIVLGDKYER